MEIEEVRELSNEAKRHGIKHEVKRIGTTGDEFEYTLDFGGKLVYKKARAASKFIDSIISEHNLVEGQKKYRVAFGWEIF
jgi:hypothetical protein